MQIVTKSSDGIELNLPKGVELREERPSTHPFTLVFTAEATVAAHDQTALNRACALHGFKHIMHWVHPPKFKSIRTALISSSLNDAEVDDWRIAHGENLDFQDTTLMTRLSKEKSRASMEILQASPVTRRRLFRLMGERALALNDPLEPLIKEMEKFISKLSYPALAHLSIFLEELLSRHED